MLLEIIRDATTGKELTEKKSLERRAFIHIKRLAKVLLADAILSPPE